MKISTLVIMFALVLASFTYEANADEKKVGDECKVKDDTCKKGDDNKESCCCAIETKLTAEPKTAKTFNLCVPKEACNGKKWEDLKTATGNTMDNYDFVKSACGKKNDAGGKAAPFLLIIALGALVGFLA